MQAVLCNVLTLLGDRLVTERVVTNDRTNTWLQSIINTVSLVLMYLGKGGTMH